MERPQWVHFIDHFTATHSDNMKPKEEHKVNVELLHVSEARYKSFCIRFLPNQLIFGIVKYSSKGMDTRFYGHDCVDEFWLDLSQKRNGDFVPFLRSKITLNEVGTENLEKTVTLHFKNSKPRSLVFKVTKKMK